MYNIPYFERYIIQITIVFAIAISIVVANITEGLLQIVTLSLTLSAYRMNAKNLLSRNRNISSVICSDKIGTITSDKMSVSHVYATNSDNDTNNKDNVEILQSRKSLKKINDNSYSYFKLFRVAILCNNAHKALNKTIININ